MELHSAGIAAFEALFHVTVAVVLWLWMLRVTRGVSPRDEFTPLSKLIVALGVAQSTVAAYHLAAAGVAAWVAMT